MAELLGNMSYMDIVLLVLIVVPMISVVRVQRNTKRKIVETEEKIASLQQYQGQVSTQVQSSGVHACRPAGRL